MTEDEIKAEIADIRARLYAQMNQVHGRIGTLRYMLNGPSVTPVIHFKRWGEDRHEDGGDSLASAMYSCIGKMDAGAGCPEGISIGGAFMSWKDLQDDPRCPADLWD